jgi:hypothetical protein
MAIIKKISKKDSAESKRFPFGPKNYAIFAVAFVSIVIGFVLLAKGDISVSPFLLVLGYAVLIPVAILWKNKPEDKTVKKEVQ